MVNRVQCPKMADGFQIHPTSPTLGKRDRQAQRAAYDVSRFAAKGGKGSGPPVAEVDWRWRRRQRSKC